jgi:hypothetical protein
MRAANLPKGRTRLVATLANQASLQVLLPKIRDLGSEMLCFQESENYDDAVFGGCG